MHPVAVLSPHYDDAALSCGAYLHRLASEGSVVTIFNVFARLPTPISDRAYVSARRREDVSALGILGVQRIHRLELLDYIYRFSAQTPKARARMICGSIAPQEAELGHTIAAKIVRRLHGKRHYLVLAPLGVGGHVDHRHAHRAGLELMQKGHEVLFYEDYPYVERAGALAAVLGQGTRFVAQTKRVREADIAAKIDAVCAYRTQVHAPSSQIAARIRSYAKSVGEPFMAERFWRAQ